MAELAKRLDALEKENALLREHLSRYENPKNSGMPPSQDPFRKTKSLRGRSKRLPGGQKGHSGNKLSMVAHPDVVVVHDVAHCGGCGHRPTVEADGHDARQVFDIPPIKVEVTGHRRLHRTCPDCGQRNKGSFPEGGSSKRPSTGTT